MSEIMCDEPSDDCDGLERSLTTMNNTTSSTAGHYKPEHLLHNMQTNEVHKNVHCRTEIAAVQIQTSFIT